MFHVKHWVTGGLLLALLLFQAGCATGARPAPPPGPVPDPSVCQSAWMSGQRTLVRDLTVPFGSRRYIREDGSVCRPLDVPAITAPPPSGPVMDADPDPEMVDVSIDEVSMADTLPTKGPSVWLATAWDWLSGLWTPTERT